MNPLITPLLKNALSNTNVGESSIYIGIFLIIMGIVIRYFKLYPLIAGYNTLSPEEKAKVPIKKLATLMRNVLVLMGIIMIACFYLSEALANPTINQVGFFVSLVGGVILLMARSNLEVS
ncbi:DUF3784 domain-containing protein [Patiriisocius sp. Uisw_017]|uniref:DUF3784 domain-containing protein n=1 Tax=Patiriisocius sp. Uisw_017 TaxID=3230968 RepID=UPI0039E7ABFD